MIDESGVVYRSVEHAYQAAKASTQAERELIINAPTPMEAKELAATFVLPEGWADRKVGVMRAFLCRKFAPGTDFAAQLLATGDAHLVEGNNWGDDFWGCCSGSGANHLGRLLMELRSELKGSIESGVSKGSG